MRHPESPDRSDFIREIVAADLADRQAQDRRHALPARAERLPAHRPRQVDLPQLRDRRRSSAAAATCASTTRTRRRRSRSTSTRSRHDVRWLGFDWGEHLYHASDYFEQLYEWAAAPDQGGQGLRRRPLGGRDPRVPRHAHRAGPQQPLARPRRSRRTSTSSRACARASSRTARACCARRSTWPRGNINLRDPVLYRILHAAHPRTGDAWCVYPTYDFAHGQSDAIEGITHSICTLEFEDHRPLYDWLLENLPVPSRPRQIEFARLNLTYTVLSKRFLLQLVEDGRVRGWDDPRMPTISGIRRRGFPAEGMRRLRRAMIGVGKRDGVVEYAMLEHCVRDVLNKTALRRFGGAAAAEARRSRTTRKARSRSSTPSTTPRTPGAGYAPGAVLARALDRARRLHGGPAEEVLPPRARAARCGCATRTS